MRLLIAGALLLAPLTVRAQFGNKNAILAISLDGAALPAKERPFRVVLPGEEYRARWIRMVKSLSLVRVGN